MKSTKTFNEMCNFVHELLTSLGYTYKLHSNLMEYYLGEYNLFKIYNDDIGRSIWHRVSFDSVLFKVVPDENDEYDEYEINGIKNYATKFVKDYKQKSVDRRKKDIEKDFQ